MSTLKPTDPRLRALVAARYEQIVKFWSFAEALMETEDPSVTEGDSGFVTRMLCCLEGFSFSLSTGEGMMAGNTLTIWYHPGKSTFHEKEDQKVLKVYYQDRLCECHVEIFADDAIWMLDLFGVMEDAGEVITRIRLKKEREHKKVEREWNRAVLERRARRLKIE